MKTCPYCTTEVQDSAIKCKHCGGWFANDAEVRQQKLDQDERLEKILKDKKDKIGEEISERTEYFSVSVKKLVIMCIMTFGIYEVYWFYKNWKAIKVQENKKLAPFWRAIFSIVYCFSLFKRILLSATHKGYKPKMSHGILAVFYISFYIFDLEKLPDPFWLLSFLSFIPLIYVSDAIRHNNAKIKPQFIETNKLSKPEIAFIIIGILLWILTILDYMYPG
jgi:magnesium-transporting ATPase (P-type)